MSEKSINQPASDPAQRFAQNIVAEALTIVIIFLFGIVSSILIVRGLPQIPIYEFYVYILVFTWVNVLIPIGIMGMDVALMKHVPEVANRRSASLLRVVGWSLFTAIVASLGIVSVVNLLLVWLPPDLLVPGYTIPFLQLALFTIPLTAVSTVLQGFFRGLQEMRYCTLAMSLYHGAFFAGLAFIFFTGTMTLLGVILVNLMASGLTIAFEVMILWILVRGHRPEFVRLTPFGRPMVSTAVQALMFALLGSVFLYVPLLIANLHRTSEVVLAGLGLALSVAVYIQQGQAAPFRVLMPRTSSDVVKQAWTAIQGYMRRAWKLGVLFSAFVAVIAVFYAAPMLIVQFAGEGMVAVPFFILMAGSFFIYPLTAMMMDTLIGLGNIRSVLATFAAWTGMVVFVLWFLTPIGQEMIVALVWLVGIPFFLIFLGLYHRRIEAQLPFSFILKSGVVLAGIALLSYAVLWVGSFLITLWNLVGVVSWVFQVGLILTLVPLAVLYLWSLFKTRVFDSDDVLALLQISKVLDPISRPVSWLIERMNEN